MLNPKIDLRICKKKEETKLNGNLCSREISTFFSLLLYHFDRCQCVRFKIRSKIIIDGFKLLPEGDCKAHIFLCRHFFRFFRFSLLFFNQNFEIKYWNVNNIPTNRFNVRSMAKGASVSFPSYVSFCNFEIFLHKTSINRKRSRFLFSFLIFH